MALPLALAASGCELIASVDRSLIPSGEGATGGSGDAGDSSIAGSTAGVGGHAHAGAGGQASGGEAGDAGGDSGASGADSSAGASGEDTGGHGGASGSGGVSGSAGSAGKGGVSGAGGVSGNGGVSGSVGVSGSGGSSGGASGSSGVSGSSGTSGNSGDSGTGGTSGTGGGATDKVIYLTSAPKKANFGGITAADALCNATPPIPGTYKALLVDGTTRVACTSASCVTSGAAEGKDWALAPSTKYVRADGTTVIGTTSAAAIFTFPLTASFGTSGISYWTGLSADWTTSADTCTSWSEVSGVSASVGLGDTSDSQAIAGAIDSCSTLAGNVFACVQQ